MEDEEFKTRAVEVGYPVKVFEVLDKRRIVRTGHTLFESPHYPVSITFLLSAPELSVYFGTSRPGLIPQLMGIFERHQPINWNWEKDNSYLRYWFPEWGTQDYKSCSEEKWLQILGETIDKLMH